MSKFRTLFLVLYLYLVLARAGYTIDDSDYSTLKFSENPAGPVWGPFGSDTGEVLKIRLPNGTMQTVDATQCYDGTYTYAACSASNNCAVQFSFTGSGLTIYVLQAGPQGMSASLSIDSGTATTATLGAPPAPQYYIPHVTLFNVQNIPSGTHTAVMTVLDWNGGFSGMMLDYIDVNQAEVAGPTSGSPTPTTAQSPSSTPPTSTNPQPTSQQTSSLVASVLSSQSSGVTALPSSTSSGSDTGSANSLSPTSKKTNLTAVVGGVVGGVVGLLALLGLAFFCFRRRRRQRIHRLSERPNPLFLPQPETSFIDADADPFASSAMLVASRPSRASRPLQSWTDSEAGSTAYFAARGPSNPSPMTDSSHMRVTPSGNDSATSSVPISIGVAAATPPDQDASAPARTAATTAVPVSYPDEKSQPPPGSGTPQQDQVASLDVPNARTNTVLTDDQADFVNSLFNNNVPAPVVARVLERMLANPQGVMSGTGFSDPELRSHLNLGNMFTLSQAHAPAGVAPWQPTMSDIGDGGTTMSGTAPPSYDYARAQ